ncbi:MAG: hypothetical protein KBA31_07925 [Alphaproteobacteria bacterium]|nr:hypothetical protein [Alphaproteobacteria bacterium]
MIGKQGESMNRNIVISILAASLTSGCAMTPGEPLPLADAWTASKTTDPITSVSRCVVAVPDSVNVGTIFYSTRIGRLYPFVESNSQLGLLVGVGSGGQFRMPVGDVVWRVDDKPFRTLRVMDNPGSANVAVAMPARTGPASNPTEKAMREATDLGLKMAQSITSSATVASGAKAKEMLAEMLEGKGLIFRSAAAAPAYGLPSSTPYSVGQYTTTEGQRPIPIDESFRQSLAACGIR